VVIVVLIIVVGVVVIVYIRTRGRFATLAVTQDGPKNKIRTIFSERELTFTLAICRRPSVCRLSSVYLSVTFVRPTQEIEIFGNVSTSFGTLATADLSVKS